MMLALFIAASDGRKSTIKSICVAGHVPLTTALRHLRWLTEQGLVDRADNLRDARSTHVQLSEAGYVAMRRYLTALVSAEDQVRRKVF